jgi:hypothetical protein
MNSTTHVPVPSNFQMLYLINDYVYFWLANLSAGFSRDIQKKHESIDWILQI